MIRLTTAVYLIVKSKNMSIKIEATDDSDDPRFLTLVKMIINRIDDQRQTDEIWIVRIKGWFDHKWLTFSGKGLVPFDPYCLCDPPVALGEFFQNKTTFPPFTPNRVLKHQRWIHEGSSKLKGLVHPRQFESSARNLHRRVEHFSQSGLFIWYSSNSIETGQGAIMVYCIERGAIETWYASFRLDTHWTLQQTKGIDRKKVMEYLEVLAEQCVG